jgi:DUF1365 family protein
MQSCLYRGWVRHRRYARPGHGGHAFRYRVFLLYLALDELEQGALSAARISPLFSIDRPNLISFRRRDYLGDAAVPLDRAVRDLVERETGRRPAGRIGLLTHPRYFGYVMNPVSFYYCYTPAGDAVETVVAEIENTPWGERHAYVLDEAQNLGGLRQKRYRFGKSFHVSPFMPMQQTYDWRFRTPGEHVVIHMQSFEQRGERDGEPEERVFDATMALRRQPLEGRALHGALLRHPFMTGKVIAAIYWQALRLWLGRAPFHEHPATRTRGRTRSRKRG